MKDYIAAGDAALLERNGLAGFDALWSLQLQAVDEPNVERGGWSSVFRLELEGAGFYLKRQSNHLTRTLSHPLGEPTFAREFRNILRYQRRGIPALQASFYGARRVGAERRAVLLTRALDGWSDLDSWLARWQSLAEAERLAITEAVGGLARQLHEAGQMHGCFYPKHIFLRPAADRWQACLIDLEKTRPLLFGRRDRIKDLEPLFRRANPWHEAEVRQVLSAYLGSESLVASWLEQLIERRRDKERR